MASQTRRERRKQNKYATFEANVQNKIAKEIAAEYKHLVVTVMESYKERLNRYLKTLSPEMIQQIGYDQIDFKCDFEWKVPDSELSAKLRSMKNVRLETEEKIFFSSVQRIHLKNTKDGFKLVETVPIEANVSYNPIDLETNTRAFKTKYEIEVSAFSNLLGKLCERGIEYLEADRQTQVAREKELQKQGLQVNLKEVDDIFDNAIKQKEKEGKFSEKLHVTPDTEKKLEKQEE